MNKSKILKRPLLFLGFKKLPCLFHGRLIWLTPKSWPGFRCNYEADIAGIMEEKLRSAEWFVDVGAHFGLWSLYADRVFAGKKPIHAFEPSPAFPVLAENARGHDCLRIHRCAISNQRKRIVFYSQGMATSGSVRESITRINEKYQPEVEVIGGEIDCLTLDEITQNLWGCGLVKIDCEGHEFKVLEGSLKSLTKPIELVIEIHPPQLKEEGDSPEKVFKNLQINGYKIKKVANRESTIFTVFAYRA
ncbi:FkbM family methyltransferase [bacterium]|nr:FkbM family methyltransferase [bacterium]